MSILTWLFGHHLATADEGQHRVGVWAGIPMLGLDALASAAYGPEAALTVLIVVGSPGVAAIKPITFLIVGLLALVYLSYRQTIAAYPGGGGSYTVARENLGVTAGLFAAAALMVDYVLVVAVGISAGIGASGLGRSGFAAVHAAVSVWSHWPQSQQSTCAVCANRASPLPSRRISSSCRCSACVAIGVVKTLISGGHPTPVVAPAILKPRCRSGRLVAFVRRRSPAAARP